MTKKKTTKKKTTKRAEPVRRRRDRSAGERTTTLPEIPQAPESPEERAPQHHEVERSAFPASYSWPEGKPLPDVYVVREPQPCPKCLRTRTDHGSQAVVCDRTGGVAYLRCRRPSCGHRWQLPTRRV